MRPCQASLFRKIHCRNIASQNKPKPPDRYNFNPEISFDDAPDPKPLQYPTVTSQDLAQRTTPPTCVKMLIRDYIEDSLYNPHYGYFSKQATVFSSFSSEDSGGFD